MGPHEPGGQSDASLRTEMPAGERGGAVLSEPLPWDPGRQPCFLFRTHRTSSRSIALQAFGGCGGRGIWAGSGSAERGPGQGIAVPEGRGPSWDSATQWPASVPSSLWAQGCSMWPAESCTSYGTLAWWEGSSGGGPDPALRTCSPGTVPHTVGL